MEDNKHKKILVTGATGAQGGAAVRHLLARGFGVSALTRDPRQADAHLLARKGAEVVEGDLDLPLSVQPHLQGVNGVFAVFDFWEHGYDKEIQQGKNLIDAAKEAGVGHFVYSSVASADRNTGLPHFESKRILEDHLKASGLPHTIFRPVFFMENFDVYREDILEGHLKMAMPPDRKLQMIAVDDIGNFIDLAFSQPEDYLGKTLEIAGAEMTMAQVAEVFSGITNRQVQFEEIPLDILRSGNPEAARMFEWFREAGYTVDLTGLRKRYPWLKTFGEWALSTRWDTTTDSGAASHRPVPHSQSPTITG
jgi:uncharacterized protein YbjT (DUF2867 family)